MCLTQGVRLVELGDLYFDVSLLLWCCSLVWLTHRGLCSAYVPMLMVAFPLVTRLLLTKEFKHRGKHLQLISAIFKHKITRTLADLDVNYGLQSTT